MQRYTVFVMFRVPSIIILFVIKLQKRIRNMKNSQKTLKLVPDRSPFDNMIIRPHRSPRLKPILINPHPVLKISRSAGSLRDKIVLPPIPRIRINFKPPKPDRVSIQTPRFKVTSEKHPSSTRHFRELSFGDIEENVESLGDLMKKYGK